MFGIQALYKLRTTFTCQTCIQVVEKPTTYPSCRGLQRNSTYSYLVYLCCKKTYRTTYPSCTCSKKVCTSFTLVLATYVAHDWQDCCTSCARTCHIRVRGNIDYIAICILRHAICILQKILGNIVLDSKSFWFRRKYPYCNLVWIFWWKFGQTRSNTLDFYTNYPTPLLCTTLTIGAAARNPNYRGSRTQPKLSGLPHATLTIGAAARNPNYWGCRTQP